MTTFIDSEKFTQRCPNVPFILLKGVTRMAPIPFRSNVFFASMRCKINDDWQGTVRWNVGTYPAAMEPNAIPLQSLREVSSVGDHFGTHHKKPVIVVIVPDASTKSCMMSDRPVQLYVVFATNLQAFGRSDPQLKYVPIRHHHNNHRFDFEAVCLFGK